MIRLNENRIKIAIQKSGRLTDSTIDLLRRSGLEFEAYGERLFSSCSNFPLEILFLRDDDIPEYVQDGICDLGVVGRNVTEERSAKVSVLESLGFGRCRLCIAIPKDASIRDLKGLKGMTIATSYPIMLKRFLEAEGIKANVVFVKGSVEVTPSLRVADAICDLVATGTTLRTSGLRVMETILESEALLIACPKSLKKPSLQRDIERLLLRIRATLLGRQSKYVMMNAPKKALPRIITILPGLASPTVMPLAKKGMIAIHSVVPEDTFWEVMERLKAAGATGILVVPIEKMVL